MRLYALDSDSDDKDNSFSLDVECKRPAFCFYPCLTMLAENFFCPTDKLSKKAFLEKWKVTKACYNLYLVN